MCGIAGFIDPSSSEPEARVRMDRMLELLAHRGPDGGGVHVEHGLAIGMRRLSIIDLEGGAQPIWNEDRTVAVVFNGEIYNYVELCRELIVTGHQFRTQTDTETLVHLYEQHGEAMLRKLRGMFAFALLDLRQGRLLLARDHFGQKPLYYAQERDRLAFASELKSLLTLPWVSRERDADAFLDYISWFSLPSPRTHFRGIRKLPAGSYMNLSFREAAVPEVRKFWSYDLDEPPDLTALEPATECLDAALRGSVKLHLRADVPVGVLLSSGLDSRTISAYAQELQERQIQTFTAGFCGPESEARGAAETAKEIGARHHTVELAPEDLLQNLERVAWHLDEPIGDPAAFAVLKVCEMARDHVKVLLSGEGADELFAGYDGRYLGMMAAIRRSDKFRPFRKLMPAAYSSASSSRWQRLLARAQSSRAAEAVSLRIEGFPGDVRTPRGLTPAQLQRLRAAGEAIAHGTYRRQRDLLSELLVLDLDWQLAECLLQKADKMSMAASIELRTPILDAGVADIAARISSDLKVPPGGPGKLVLRHCLAKKLNESMSRPKRGFPVPLAQWFSGPLRDPIEAAIFASDAACLQYLERPRLRAAWDEFLAGRWDGGRTLYALWLYEVWNRKFSA